MRKLGYLVAVFGLLAIIQTLLCAQASAQSDESYRIVSEWNTGGFALPESVAYHPETKALYVGQFGSILQPSLADGKGKISKQSFQVVVPDLMTNKLHFITLSSKKTRRNGTWRPEIR